MSPAPTSGRTGPRRVLLHIGLPKTGTTYLQQVVWGNRDRLQADGVRVEVEDPERILPLEEAGAH